MESQAPLLAECLLAWTETGASMAERQDPISDCPLCASTSHLPSFTCQSQPKNTMALVLFVGHHGIFFVSTSLGSKDQVILWVAKGWYISSFYLSSDWSQLHPKVLKSKHITTVYPVH